MRIRLVITAIYLAAVAAPATLFAGQGSLPRDTAAADIRTSASGADAADQEQTSASRMPKIIELDTYGARGIVRFDHDKHQIKVNPDPAAAFKAKASAACAGCHHTVAPPSGIIQLWRCAACHKTSGDPSNPLSKDFDEQWSKTANHRLCIGCHQSSNVSRTANLAPVKCGDCHQSSEMARNLQ